MYEIAVVAETSVVDEDVDRDACALGRVVDLLRRIGRVQVGGDDADFRVEFGGEVRGEGIRDGRGGAR